MREEQEFDPRAFKETTRQQWQAAAAAWYRWTPTLCDWLGPVTALMLDLACIGPGARVLDVASGAGEPALSVARRVGPTGSVLATDIAANMLAIAMQEARARGLGEALFQTRVMDGENLELDDATFDAAVSRLGLIFFPDRIRGLAEMRRVLKPGGRAVIAGFTTPARNLFFSLPLGIIRRRMHRPLPAPDQPGPFSLGDPAVMAAAFRAAGFRTVETRLIDTVLRLPSATACAQFERESFGALHQLMRGLPVRDCAIIWEEITWELRRFEVTGEFEAPAELCVGCGIK